MTTKKAWGGLGAWAADAEQAEEEERAAAEAAAVAAAAAVPSESFPSLREAAAAKPKKKKAMSLSEFTTGSYVGPGGGARQHHHQVFSESKGLTPNEMLRLPTGPKERSAEELDHRGFRSYGVGGAGIHRGGGDDRDGDRRRPYGGGFEEDSRRGSISSRVSDFDQMPSRADEVDNWAATKKSFGPPPPGMDSGRQDRYQALGSGGGGGVSKADEVDNWSMGKKQLPQLPSSRYSGFGSGFRDSSTAPSDSDRWARGGPLPPPQNGDRERPRLVLEPRKGDTGAPSEPARTRPSPFGVARPREEVLAEKGVDWRKVDSENEVKTSRPTSSQSNRPSSAHSSRPESPTAQVVAVETAPKPRPKVNPFGDAKPREVLLQEQGIDWRKIDLELEHRSIDRPETEEEKLLKEEINYLNELLVKGTEAKDNGEPTAGEVDSLREQINNRERDLERLTHELDAKVRFGQRATGDRRPGSGSGRLGVFPDRPPSQSGMSEEFIDRPGSRGGMGDMWNKPIDDRRSFQRGREGGFLGNRNMDRSKSRERW